MSDSRFLNRLDKIDRAIIRVEGELRRLEGMIRPPRQENVAPASEQRPSDEQREANGSRLPPTDAPGDTQKPKNPGNRPVPRRSRIQSVVARVFSWPRWKRTFEFIGVAAAVFYAVVSYNQWRDLRHNFEVSQRAWLGVDLVHALNYKANQHLGVGIDFKNTGLTPATVVSATATITSWARSSRGDFAENAVIQADKLFVGPLSQMAIAPGATSPIQIVEPNETDEATFDSMAAGTVQHHFSGSVLYRDAFGHMGETTFCVVLTGDPQYLGPGHPFPPCRGNVMK